MAEEQGVYVRMLGMLSLHYGVSWDEEGNAPVDVGGRARRIWSLICYLIVHRDRNVPTSELIDVLWSEDEARCDPLKTLQHNVSRARDMLARQGIPDARGLIVSSSNCYRWNPGQPTFVDVDLFQDAAAKSLEVRDATARIASHQQALSLYRGNFLPGLETFDWTTPISVYNHTLYVSQSLALAQLLGGRENACEIETVCERALRLAPDSEELNACYIRALVVGGSPDKAIEVYEGVKDRLDRRLGVTPSTELELAYEEARRAVHTDVVLLDDLKAMLEEESFDGRGMHCDWNSFASLVRREARNSTRAKGKAGVLSLRFEGVDAERFEVRSIENVLAKCLRAGDVYTELGDEQILALLPEAGEAGVRTIARRLGEHFKQKFSESGVTMACEWYMLEAPSRS